MIAKNLLHILQHSLGLDRYGQGRQYRNHYCAGPDDVGKCRELVSQSFMKEFPPSEISGGDPIFIVTAQGIDAVTLESPPPPKLTRGQKRYREYLEVSDCFDDFKHYLEWKQPS